MKIFWIICLGALIGAGLGFGNSGDGYELKTTVAGAAAGVLITLFLCARSEQ